MALYDVVLGLVVDGEDEVDAAKKAAREAATNPNVTVLVGKKVGLMCFQSLTHCVRLSDWAYSEIPDNIRQRGITDYMDEANGVEEKS